LCLQHKMNVHCVLHDSLGSRFWSFSSQWYPISTGVWLLNSAVLLSPRRLHIDFTRLLWTLYGVHWTVM
jgi:hypothetical protein